ATKFPDITEDANKIQMDNRKKAKTIDYPDEFTLESVKERLDAYNVKTLPNCKALADVMVMLSIRPAELTTLRKPGVKWFNRFLKDYGLIPKYLRKMGAVYGVVVHEPENMAQAYTIAGECLRHNPDNHTSPVQNYVVVNYRKKGQTPEQARP
ncbi:9530_t:CDS:2, partial [Entrophospora sp. SA101]